MRVRFVVWLVLMLAAAWSRAGEAGVVASATLDNGVRVVAARAEGPDAAVWLVIDAGSLHEPEGLAGVATLAQRMVIQGADRFRPGEVERVFEPSERWAGKAAHGVVGYDRSAVTLIVPGAKEASIGLALRFCADALTSVRFDAGVFEQERARAQERLLPMEGPGLSAQRGLLDALAPGLGERWPGGSREGLGACTAGDARAFWEAWYAPARATVIVVGPEDAGELVRRARAALEGVPARAGAAGEGLGAAPTRGVSGAVVEAPGLSRAAVALVRVEADPGARPDRERVLDELAAGAAHAELEARRAGGALGGFETQAEVQAVRGLGRIVALGVVGPAGDEAAMACDLRAEAARVGRGGVSASAIAAARGAVADRARDGSGRDEHAGEVARRIERALGEGREPATPAREREAVERALASIGDDEVSARAAALFAMRDAVVVVQTPTVGEVDRDALVRGVEAMAAEERAPEPIELAAVLGGGRPARIVELGQDIATGVTSAWLDNGVRVRHRRMEAGRVEVRVTLACGALDEGAGERGLSEAAASAMVASGLGTLDAGGAARALAAAGITVESGAGDDLVWVTLRAPEGRVREALLVVGSVLRSPRVSGAAVSRWRAEASAQIAADAHNPARVAERAVREAWAPGAHPLAAGEVGAIDAEGVRAWAARVAGSPASVVIVGDVAWDEALDAAAEGLGGVGARERPAFRGRGLAAPVAFEAEASARGAAAAVAWGVTGPGLDEIGGARAMNAAAVVLGRRLSERLEGGEAAVSGVWAWYDADGAVPERSRLRVVALTDPARVGAVAGAIEEAAEELAAGGPTAEEMEAVGRWNAQAVERSLGSASFWARRLGEMDHRGRPLDDLATMARDYERLTGERVERAFVEAWAGGERYRVIVTPGG